MIVRSTLPTRLLVVTGDVLCIAGGLATARFAWLAMASTPSTRGDGYLDLLGLNGHMPAAILLMALWIAALRVQGLYDPLRMVSAAHIGQSILRATVSVLVAAILVEYVASHRTWSRLLLVSFVGFSSLYLTLFRLASFEVRRRYPDRMRREGVVVIGVGEDARLLSERLARYGHHAYRVVAHVAPQDSEPVAVGDTAFHPLVDLKTILEQHDVSLVILASRTISRDEALGIATLCARRQLDVLQVPFTWGIVAARVESAAVGELELVKLGGLSYPPAAVAAKRLFDVIAVLLGGALLLPGLPIVAAIIYWQDRGPVFYASDRAGQGGKPFPFYKFRSMHVGADQIRDTLPNESDGRLFKLTGDPRITPFGHFMRRWSIDELPQIYNVLRGDMNLVGPRPLPMEDLRGLDDDPEHRYWFDERSRVKPGLTGLWQIEGRSDLPFRRMMELDVAYIQHWSLLLDLQILVRTVPAVLRGRGAR